MKLQLVDYDPELIERMNAMHDACIDKVTDDDIAANADHDLVVRARDTAQSWVGAGAHWGLHQPGVSMDCVGITLALASQVGVINMPFAMAQRLGGMSGRAEELKTDPVKLNRRLQAYLIFIVMRCTAKGYYVIPIPKPDNLLPLDIFITPYTWAVEGTVMLPHAMICAYRQKFLTNNPLEKQVYLIDAGDYHQIGETLVLDNGQSMEATMFNLRFFKGDPPEGYKKYRDDLVALARTYHKELKHF